MMKTVSVPDVAECAHAAEVAAPVKDDWPAEGGNVAACPQTPTDSPRRTLAERGPLPADALALLNGIDLKNSVQKDVEKPEAQKLLAVAQHIDTLVTLFNDDSTMWPSNEDVAIPARIRSHARADAPFDSFCARRASVDANSLPRVVPSWYSGITKSRALRRRCMPNKHKCTLHRVTDACETRNLP